MHKQNDLTRLKLQIPRAEKQLNVLNEQIRQFRYEIDQFENPSKLMEMACDPHFHHLKHPLMKDVETIPEGIASSLEKPNEDKQKYYISPIPIGMR